MEWPIQEGIIASGAILYYLSETQHNKVQHITNIQRIAEDAYVWMDRFTIRNFRICTIVIIRMRYLVGCN